MGGKTFLNKNSLSSPGEGSTLGIPVQQHLRQILQRRFPFRKGNLPDAIEDFSQINSLVAPPNAISLLFRKLEADVSSRADAHQSQ